MSANIRIGIDVGGTFTHAVAIDGITLAVKGRVKVPTTHRAAEGVARGIIESLQKLIVEAGISPEDVAFIAHSTTQATNALLEGDVAPVGILGMGGGANAYLARMATNIRRLKLAPEKYLVTYHRFIDTTRTPRDREIEENLERLIEAGARAVAISEAFSVDAPDNERRALEIARQMGLPATSGSEVSQLYGLKVRTRTAVVNASMMPKMIEAADMTEKSVRESGIKAPIMIMRSDGGVMDINAMRQKPILTMLSGPAAGVAAAMMYLHISDGIFLEVGGTSTDISAIRNGRALVRSAEVGGHRLYMRTLDVRTVGIAGGSMPRLKGAKLIDVGPRSAHIAGLGYISFTERLSAPRLHEIRPQPGDPGDYLAFSDGEDGAQLCLTPTCAANFAGLIPPGDCAAGNMEPIRQAIAVLAERLDQSAEKTADDILRLSSAKAQPVVAKLIKEYKLDPTLLSLVGGGGGAAALVPYLAKQAGMRHALAENADVISAIGVALALVRETVERQFVKMADDDILRVRQDAFAAVERMGAEPATIEVHVEVDARTNTVRATASGATPMTAERRAAAELGEDDLKRLAAESMRIAPEKVALVASTEHFRIFAGETADRHLGGLFRLKCHSLRTLDTKGVVRLQTRNGAAAVTTAGQAERALADLAEEHSQYGDAGRIIPQFMLLAGPRIIDLSGLLNAEQVTALARIELEMLPRDEQVVVIANF